MKRDFTNEDAVMETLRHNIRRRRPSDGPGLLMSLMMCEAIIDRKSLQAATSIKALAYETSSGARLSWQIDGWIDARYLSSSSLQRIQARGPIVGAQDWEELEQAINQLFGITLDE